MLSQLSTSTPRPPCSQKNFSTFAMSSATSKAPSVKKHMIRSCFHLIHFLYDETLSYTNNDITNELWPDFHIPGFFLYHSATYTLKKLNNDPQKLTINKPSVHLMQPSLSASFTHSTTDSLRGLNQFSHMMRPIQCYKTEYYYLDS